MSSAKNFRLMAKNCARKQPHLHFLPSHYIQARYDFETSKLVTNIVGASAIACLESRFGLYCYRYEQKARKKRSLSLWQWQKIQKMLRPQPVTRRICPDSGILVSSFRTDGHSLGRLYGSFPGSRHVWQENHGF
jgi:hypothetical protein